MKRRKNAYLLRVAHSLTACQQVEFALKYYITGALTLVTRCVGSRTPFGMAGSDYMDASLERLIEVFKKLSANPSLVKKLNKFRDDRNFVAHRAIAACLDSEGDLVDTTALAIEPRLDEIESRASQLAEAIHKEGAKIIAYSYIDLPKG
jgi:hypothetical protein